MPIYAYRCESCGFEKDALQKMSDPPLTDCPNCGQPALKKQVTAAGFQLKGSGWYVTDFRDGNKQKGGDKPASTSADAKPADAGAGSADAAKPAADKSASTGDAKTAAPAPAASPAPSPVSAPASGSSNHSSTSKNSGSGSSS